MMVSLGVQVYTLYRVKTIRIAAISVMINPGNCFSLLVFSCALLLSPEAKVRLEAVEMRGVRRPPHRLD